MKRGDDDAGEVMRMGPRPLYRSRLLWLGVPGLVFLLWVWVDSLTMASAVMSTMELKGRAFGAKSDGPEVSVQEGMVCYHRSWVIEASPDIVMTRGPRRFERRKESIPVMRTRKDGLYGLEVMERELPVSPSRLSAKAVLCWFPVGFVVAGYGVVWLGSLVMWRWWMRRRWRASRAVEVMP